MLHPASDRGFDNATVPPSDLHLRLLHKPAITDDVPARARRLDQQGREPLHPPLDRDVIHLDTALGQQLLYVTVRQAIARIPTHRQHDHLRRKTETSEAGPQRERGSRATTHQPSLPEHVIGQRNSAL